MSKKNTSILNKPLITIVGETASGKSALALQVAEHLNGEIIAADSRTIYTGMDIGTAKPSQADRRMVPHHMLDIVRPDEAFTAAEFKQYAIAAINDIHARGKLPIMVGGTGLYVDSILYDYEFLPKANADVRNQLNNMSIEELQSKLHDNGIALPENQNNPRHLIRALETGGQQAAKKELRANTLVIGLSIDREILHERIVKRVVQMLAGGLEDEVTKLVQAYGWSAPGMTAVGYKEFKNYFEGTQSIDDVGVEIIKNTQAYAKRQRTWFRRNKSIHWITTPDEALKLTTDFLNNNL